MLIPKSFNLAISAIMFVLVGVEISQAQNYGLAVLNFFVGSVNLFIYLWRSRHEDQ